MSQPISSNKQLADLAFRQAWQSIFVFLVPAGLAVVVGQYLDSRHHSGKLWTIISLAIAFVLSWLIIWRRYVGFRQSVRQVKANQSTNQSDPVQPIKN